MSADLAYCVDNLRYELDKVTLERDSARRDLAEVQAQAAVMRTTLEAISEGLPCESPCDLDRQETTCPTCAHVESETWCCGCMARRALKACPDAGSKYKDELAETKSRLEAFETLYNKERNVNREMLFDMARRNKLIPDNGEGK